MPFPKRIEQSNRSDMKKVTLVVLLVLSLLLIPMSVCARSNIEIIDWQGDGRWTGNTWYINLYPGEEASMGLKIKSLVDAVIYVEYSTPVGLSIYFDPLALEIKKGGTEWIWITIYASGGVKPGSYAINFYFNVIDVESKVIYKDRDVPGPTVYVDRDVYVNREVYVDRIEYIERGVAWWWIPISVISVILITLLLSELLRRRKGM